MTDQSPPASADETSERCSYTGCDRSAQPEHNPCCSSHGRALCCEHYCRNHWVEVNKCSTETHRAERGAR